MYQRVNQQHFICKLKLYFDGDFKVLDFLGPPVKDKRFYHSIHEGNPATQIYFGHGSFNFNEVSSDTPAGYMYTQKAIFRFPSNDEKRAERIEILKNIKFLGMVLTDGSEYIMGRNDIEQNTKPKVTTSSNFHLTEVEITSESIMPVIKEGSLSRVLYGYDYVYNFELL